MTALSQFAHKSPKLSGSHQTEPEPGTLVGVELMPMIKKKQMMIEAEDEGRTEAELFYSLAA